MANKIWRAKYRAMNQGKDYNVSIKIGADSVDLANRIALAKINDKVTGCPFLFDLLSLDEV